MATIKVYPRIDRPNKQGLVSIQIEIQNKGFKVYHMIPTVRILPENWDNVRVCVKSTQNNHQGMNRIIEKEHSNVKKIVMDMEYETGGFNRHALRIKLAGQDDKDFYDFWERTIKTRDTNLVFNTLRTYTTSYNKLKEFRKSLTFSEINLDFLESFESWMRSEKGNKPNTIKGVMKHIRYMVSRARVTIGIECKAFEAYKVPSETTYRQVIQLSDIDLMLESLYSGEFKSFGGKAEQILATFCFQSLTGLRFGDASTFNAFKSIKDNNIKLCTDKTGGEVYIPIHDRLRKLLEHQNYTFKPGTNQAANRVIKAIGVALKIKCKLTTHTAVHTFCTTSHELGVDLKVISQMRGHRSIKTTEIYVQVKNAHIENEMKKWDRVG